MRFLPIVDRELREGARRAATYWSRVSVAFMAALVGVAAYLISYFNPALKFGTILFWGLAGLSMLSCLLAGRASTADCVSREKREGTLGLLFLTDLKGYDVVLGKLVATSLSAFYALLTIVPVLAIPLLSGGMTHGELWRMALVLVNTFFFSLAIGILASAATRQYRAAMAANFFLFTLVVGVPVAGAIALSFAPRATFMPVFYYSCPIFSFGLCSDDLYKTHAVDYWCSLGTTHLLAWLFVVLACWIVPRAWTDQPAVAASGRWRWREIGPLLSFGGPAKRRAFRKVALDTNAFFWLAGRARLKPAHVWVFLGVAAVLWVRSWIKNGALWLDEVTYFATAVLLNGAFKLWVGLEAGHQLGEDRRSNAFELLLVTPLTVGDILQGQWLALRRQFLRPLMVVVGVELIFAALVAVRPRTREEVGFLLGGILLLLADVGALIWVAMYAALTARSQTRAVMVAVSRVLIAPWIVFGGVMAILQACYFLDLTQETPSGGFGLGLWVVTGLMADALYGFRARRMLQLRFREMAVRPLIPKRGDFSWRQWMGKTVAAVAGFGGRLVAPRFRRGALAGLAAAVVVAGVLLARSRTTFPAPVTVSLAQNNAPMGIFPSGHGVFFVLPDGTLWRWGLAGPAKGRSGAVPEQLGTGRDWVKAVANDDYGLGLRADGTVWYLWWRHGKFDQNKETQLWPGHDWTDIGIGMGHAIGRKRDGTIWEEATHPVPPVPGRPQGLRRFARPYFQVGTATNWTAVCCRSEEMFGLRADGTLWVWGLFSAYRAGTSWVRTNLALPTLFCAETNWIGLDVGGVVRNQAGELWDARYALPDAEAKASSVCHLVSSNWVAEHVHMEPYWMKAQVRSDGTLWAASQTGPFSPPSGQDWRRLGSRSDWVDLWGLEGTWFGLTGDGTLWVWGLDLGAEPQVTFQDRVQLFKLRLYGRATFSSPIGPQQPSPPFLKEPRPLLRMVQKR